MIKKLGRIIMLAIAIAFITFSVFRIKDSVDLISKEGWEIITNAFKTGDWSGMSAFTDIGWGVLYIIVGLTALAVAISGHAGFWSFIFSALMLGFFIFNLISASKGGEGEHYIRNLSLDIVCQLIYAGGILFVMYGNHREKVAYRNYKKNH